MFTQWVISESELYAVITVHVLEIQIEIYVTPMSLIPFLIRPNNRLEKTYWQDKDSYSLNQNRKRTGIIIGPEWQG